jgi:hypothetical protein
MHNHNVEKIRIDVIDNKPLEKVHTVLIDEIRKNPFQPSTQQKTLVIAIMGCFFEETYLTIINHLTDEKILTDLGFGQSNFEQIIMTHNPSFKNIPDIIAGKEKMIKIRHRHITQTSFEIQL